MWHSRINKEDPKLFVLPAAKILLSELQSTVFNTENYPTDEEIESIDSNKAWLPELLQVLLENLIKDPLKQVSIGQAIVGAVKPRSSLPPILFGVAVEMDHVFGLKWCQSELSRLGYSSSPDEVTRYKQSVVCNEDPSDFLNHCLKGSFSQWSADNADYNVSSVDGKGNLHGVGLLYQLPVSVVNPFE